MTKPFGGKWKAFSKGRRLRMTGWLWRLGALLIVSSRRQNLASAIA
jgi:hypothetical protein